MDGNLDLNEAEKEENEMGNGAEPVKDERESIVSADIRNVSYFVLFIAAIFIVNAMETGSYRTPWPVAVIVSLAGIGLWGYSFMKQREEKS